MAEGGGRTAGGGGGAAGRLTVEVGAAAFQALAAGAARAPFLDDEPPR